MESNNAPSTRKDLKMSVTIARLRMVLRTQRLRAQPLQQRCSLWFHQEFRDQLERCLTQVQHELGGATLVLDTLRLNLGDIRAQQFEQDLSERAIKALAHELALQVAVNWVDNEAHAAEQVGGLTQASEGRHRELQTDRSSPLAEDVNLTWLLAYLDTGRRHYSLLWLPPASPSQWLHTQLDRWQTCEVAWQGRIEFAWRCLGGLSGKRLVATFTPSVLARLSRWLLAAVPAATTLDVSERQACTWLPLAAALALQRDSASRQAVQRRVSQGQWGIADSAHGQGMPLRAGATTALGVGTTKKEPRPGTEHDEGNLPHKRRLHRQGKRQILGPLGTLVRLLLAEPLTEATQAAIQLILTQRASVIDRHSAQGAHVHSTLSAALQRHRGIVLEASANPTKVVTHAPPSTGPLMADESGHLALSGAGVVLLWPLLPDLFEAHSLLDATGFIDETAQVKGVMLLDALVWGDGAQAPWRREEFCYWCGLPANRILQAPDTWQPLDSGLQVELDTWLVGGLAQIPGLDGFDAPALRALFLQRSGQLEVRDARVRLTLDTQAQDVLLRDCPWPLSHLTLPWLPLVVSLDWQTL